jgi:uncharacterized membrane protein
MILMPDLPPIPPFEAMHPLVVHFPIGILLIAWMPVLAGLIDRKRRHTWLACGALLLVVGTGTCFYAVVTGDAAERIVGTTSELIDDAIHEHKADALRTRVRFLGATLVYLLVWGAYAKVKPARKSVVLVAGGALVAITYAVAAVSLMNTGHTGGVLVHQHGVVAPIVE